MPSTRPNVCWSPDGRVGGLGKRWRVPFTGGERQSALRACKSRHGDMVATGQTSHLPKPAPYHYA